MLRIITSMLGLLGLSVIVTEAVNQFHFFNHHLKLPLVAVPALLLYLFYEFAENILLKRKEASPDGTPKYGKFISLNRLIIFLALIGMVILIPLLWWGAIKKLAMMANQGKVAY